MFYFKGVWASKTGLLDKTALSVMSKLVFGLFQPCLLFANVCATVSKQGSGGSVVTFFPIAAIMQIFLGYSVGKVVSFLLYGTKSSEESKQLLTCTTFGNSGPLPLVFVDALLKSHPDQTLLPTSVGYVSLYLLGWSPLFWIVAPAILAPEKNLAVGEKPSFDYKALVQRILSPPVIASIFGAVVGSIPGLRKHFLPADGIFHAIFESIKFIGAAYLPAVLLVLAGSLSGSSEPDEEGATDNVALAKQIMAIYLSRFLLMPSVAFALIAAARKFFPSLGSLLTDPLVLLVFLLETCMPSAQNSTVILQLQGNRKGAARMARVLMLVYVLGIPAISYWLVKILETTALLS